MPIFSHKLETKHRYLKTVAQFYACHSTCCDQMTTALSTAKMPTPRLNPYNKLLSRLFEFLALFSILKKAAGPHVITNHDSSTLEATRRRFLKNLCFICDYKKGGDTTTSIAVENRPDCFMFWVAGNVTPSRKVVDFLSGVLGHLQGAEAADTVEKKRLEAKLTGDFIRFSTPRLKKECKLLCNAARKCQDYLSTGISGTSTSGQAHIIEPHNVPH